MRLNKTENVALYRRALGELARNNFVVVSADGRVVDTKVLCEGDTVLWADDDTLLFIEDDIGNEIADYGAEIGFLAGWAARYGAALQLEGECGIGRECVGITKDNNYPAYDAWDYDDIDDIHRADWVVLGADDRPLGAPPDSVKHAYHKSPCLAVLGRGTLAVHELYLWVRLLDALNIEIVTVPANYRPETALIETILKGHTEARLVRVTS